MGRVFNFSAGPAVLPQEVLQQAAAEMLDWHGCGMGVMEMSHRGKEFQSIHDAALPAGALTTLLHEASVVDAFLNLGSATAVFDVARAYATDRFAFGRTNFHIDQEDLFVLELDSADPERYRHPEVVGAEGRIGGFGRPGWAWYCRPRRGNPAHDRTG